ncbi:MAG: hypothetical protein R2728_12470 [Chitinophagales bacterium]
MDFVTFKDKLASEDLKALKPTAEILSFLDGKYSDKEILGTFRINESFAAVYFKQKLWEKLAFFKDGAWIETRVNSLTNKLPDDVNDALSKAIKNTFSIVKVESVIMENGDFYFYVIIKMAGKKRMIHINKAGEVLVNEKYVENYIRLEEDDEDEDDDDDSDDDDAEEIEIDEEVDDFDD